MELRTDALIHFPREAVFRAYRDNLRELLGYLPNVRGIEVASRKEEGHVVDLVNEWRGGGDIPTAVRAVLGDSVLAWTDFATWNAETMQCTWRTETRAFREALRCYGQNLFLEGAPGTTRIEFRGAIEVDANKLRGVPGFVAGKVARLIEEFLVTRIQANLQETARGLEAYLAAVKQEG